MGNLFNLAELQLHREAKEATEADILAYAVKIRKWIDNHKATATKILKGGKVYHYGNKIIVK
jgi:hypothetical protein